MLRYSLVKRLILKIGFALSNRPYLHRVYEVRGCLFHLGNVCSILLGYLMNFHSNAFWRAVNDDNKLIVKNNLYCTNCCCFCWHKWIWVKLTFIDLENRFFAVTNGLFTGQSSKIMWLKKWLILYFSTLTVQNCYAKWLFRTESLITSTLTFCILTVFAQEYWFLLSFHHGYQSAHHCFKTRVYNKILFKQ